MALNMFDPSVLISDRPFLPVSAFLEGRQQGLARSQARQTMAGERRRQKMESMLTGRRMSQEEALMALSDQYGEDDPFLQQAIAASPEIAREIIKQRVAAKLKERRDFAPDNEWIDDPDDPDFQVYVRAVKDPETGKLVSQAYPGMRRRKTLAERVEWEREKLGFEKDKFTAQNLLANKKLQVEYAKLKVAQLDQNLRQAKQNYEFQKVQADVEIDYEKLRKKAYDAIDVVDRMIGNEKRGIPRHKGFKSTVGRKGAALLWGLKDMPFEGTESANFMTLYDRVTGMTFLQAYETLKGGGQITEVEGKKAEAAMKEMNTATSEKMFIEAARRFQRHLKRGLELAKKERKMKTRATGAGETTKKTVKPVAGVPTGEEIDNMTEEQLRKYLGE